MVVHFALLHTHISYVVLLWGHATSANKVLLLRDRAVHIIVRQLKGRMNVWLTHLMIYFLQCKRAGELPKAPGSPLVP